MMNQKIQQYLQAGKNKKIIEKARKELREKDFTIISQNCIGGVFYHDMGLRFLSPTINLFIPEPDFIKMVSDLKKYMEAEPVVSWNGKYPVGILCDDVMIHFLHYNSCEDAYNKWEERKKRILWDCIIIVATDRDGFNSQVFKKWGQIHYPKVLFTVHQEYAKDPGTVLLQNYLVESEVPDLIPKREFYKNNTLVSMINRSFLI